MILCLICTLCILACEDEEVKSQTCSLSLQSTATESINMCQTVNITAENSSACNQI